MWVRPKYERLQNIWQKKQNCNIKQWDTNISLFGKLDVTAPLEEMGPIKIFTTLILFQGRNLVFQARNEFLLGYILSSRHFMLWSIDPVFVQKKIEKLRINRSKVSSQRHHRQMALILAIVTLATKSGKSVLHWISYFCAFFWSFNGKTKSIPGFKISMPLKPEICFSRPRKIKNIFEF